MKPASLMWTTAGHALVTAEYKGIRATVRFKPSTLPDFFDRHTRNIHAITFCGVARVSPASKGFSLAWLTELIAHEWSHGYREKKLGRVKHAVTYLWKPDRMEKDSDDFDEEFQDAFRVVAIAVRARGLL